MSETNSSWIMLSMCEGLTEFVVVAIRFNLEIGQTP